MSDFLKTKGEYKNKHHRLVDPSHVKYRVWSNVMQRSNTGEAIYLWEEFPIITSWEDAEAIYAGLIQEGKTALVTQDVPIRHVDARQHELPEIPSPRVVEAKG